MIKKFYYFEKKLLSIASALFMTYITLAAMFSRSFIGIYVFGYRVGEIFIALTLIIFLYLILFNSKNMNLMIHQSNFRILLTLMFFSFVFLTVISDANFDSSYTYKASTYIWTLSIFFLGAKSKKIFLSLGGVILIEFILLSIFFVSIYEFPQFLIEFFTEYSDKYEPHKGSDLALFFIVINLLINDKFDHNRKALNIFILNLGFFLPLVLYRSRGAFIGILIFSFYQLFIFNRNKILIHKMTVPVILLFISISTYPTIVSQLKNFPEEISPEVIANSYSSLGEYRLQHYQEDYPFLYIESGRIYSGDGNLNWRLDMWQDQIDYMSKENIILFGSGYKDKLYVFQINNTGYGNDRTGLDDINENIHNYFLQIFSRGGVIQLILFIFLFIKINKVYFKSSSRYDILTFLLPLLWVSLFDSSMENAHFPIVFYFILGNYYFSNKTFNTSQEE